MVCAILAAAHSPRSRAPPLPQAAPDMRWMSKTLPSIVALACLVAANLVAAGQAFAPAPVAIRRGI